ncbi:unnamed protein product [Polarella glacialis]|uniref:VWFD domain-containing protein n=1 Tax=Polarella glacialis TaxID=89957 RepID=A0A813JX35_POLGL|nr:unnamed protein product [Polarella glacialis]
MTFLKAEDVPLMLTTAPLDPEDGQSLLGAPADQAPSAHRGRVKAALLIFAAAAAVLMAASFAHGSSNVKGTVASSIQEIEYRKYGEDRVNLVFTLLEPSATSRCCKTIDENCCVDYGEQVCWKTEEEAMKPCCNVKAVKHIPKVFEDVGEEETVKNFFNARAGDGVPVKIIESPGQLEVQWTRGLIWFGLWNNSCEGYNWHDQVSASDLLLTSDKLYSSSQPWLGTQPALFVEFEYPYHAQDFNDCLVGPIFENCGAVPPCPHHPTTTVYVPPFDCYQDYGAGWSQDKNQWCCANNGRGCPTTTAYSEPYDCDAGYSNWLAGWSQSKKDWCCHHYHHGCPLPTTTPAPPAVGFCKLWGDPHVISFDGPQFVFYREGDFWIVKTPALKIQGRFQATQWTKDNDHTDYSSLTRIIIAGSLMDNHVIDISKLEDGGQITCDGTPILLSFGEAFCGSGRLTYGSAGELVDEAMSFLPHKVVIITLPSGVIVQVNRWSNFMNAMVKMFPMEGQDGVCGNFNGDPDDDTGKLVHKRFGNGVPLDELLFATPIPVHIPTAVAASSKCSAQLRVQAEAVCRTQMDPTDASAGWALAECVGDLCHEGHLHLPSKPFDCHAGALEIELGWSAEKKTWCCKHEQKGCQ